MEEPRTKCFWFVSGPRDGQDHWALDHLEAVEVTVDEEAWQSGNVASLRNGKYTRIGNSNLLVWEGWRI